MHQNVFHEFLADLLSSLLKSFLPVNCKLRSSYDQHACSCLADFSLAFAQIFAANFFELPLCFH